MLERVYKMSMYDLEKITLWMTLFQKHSYLIILFSCNFSKSMSSVLLNRGFKWMAVKTKYLEKIQCSTIFFSGFVCWFLFAVYLLLLKIFGWHYSEKKKKA